MMVDKLLMGSQQITAEAAKMKSRCSVSPRLGGLLFEGYNKNSNYFC